LLGTFSHLYDRNAQTNLPDLNPDLTKIVLLGAVAKFRKVTINFVVSVFKVQPKQCNVFSVYLFLQISLRVSGGSSAHHQEHKIVLTASSIVKTMLLLSATVDKLELAHDSSRQQYWFDNT
jgi:hypothetical protein